MGFSLTTSQEALIYQGRVTEVYPATMTVDIYVPEINNEFQGVYILTNNIQTTYGTISVPEVGSVGLIVLYHKSKQPVIMGFIPPFKFNQGEQKFEFLKPGESQVSGKGGAFFRSTLTGDAFVGTLSLTGSNYEKNGKNVNSFKEQEEISNFHRKGLRISCNDDIIKISDEFEIFEQLPNNKVRAEDVFKNDVIQESVLSSILADVEDVICRLNSIMTEIKNIFSKSAIKTLTPEIVSEFKKSMLEYQIQKSGLCVRGQIFNGTGFKIALYNNDAEVAGIEVDESGGKLIGTWG